MKHGVRLKRDSSQYTKKEGRGCEKETGSNPIAMVDPSVGAAPDGGGIHGRAGRGKVRRWPVKTDRERQSR